MPGQKTKQHKGKHCACNDRGDRPFGKCGTPESLLASQYHIKFTKSSAMLSNLNLLVLQLGESVMKATNQHFKLPCMPPKLGAEGEDR